MRPRLIKLQTLETIFKENHYVTKKTSIKENNIFFNVVIIFILIIGGLFLYYRYLIKSEESNKNKKNNKQTEEHFSNNIKLTNHQQYQPRHQEQQYYQSHQQFQPQYQHQHSKTNSLSYFPEAIETRKRKEDQPSYNYQQIMQEFQPVNQALTLPSYINYEQTPNYVQQPHEKMSLDNTILNDIKQIKSLNKEYI